MGTTMCNAAHWFDHGDRSMVARPPHELAGRPPSGGRRTASGGVKAGLSSWPCVDVNTSGRGMAQRRGQEG